MINTGVIHIVKLLRILLKAAAPNRTTTATTWKPPKWKVCSVPGRLTLCGRASEISGFDRAAVAATRSALEGFRPTPASRLRRSGSA
jgi:hypothetical protein